jgi:hypothetical protein
MDLGLNASLGYDNSIKEGCIMKKIYKKRIDIIDEIGKKYFDLTVIKYAGAGKYRGARWLCRCICGKECVIPGGHLRANMRKSCGCRSELRIDEVGVNRIYAGYKAKSKKRNVRFELEKNDFEKLIKGNCFYCNTPPSQILKRLKSRKLQILYNGIDKVTPSLGYIKENCVSCCRYCNQSKSDLSVDQWKEYIRRVCRWLKIDF